MEIDVVVREKLLNSVFEREKRLHGRRKVRCPCTYHKFLPYYIRAKIDYKKACSRRHYEWSEHPETILYNKRLKYKNYLLTSVGDEIDYLPKGDVESLDETLERLQEKEREIEKRRMYSIQ